MMAVSIRLATPGMIEKAAVLDYEKALATMQVDERMCLSGGYINLTGAERREWMGMDGNGGMGRLLIVIMGHSFIPY